MSPTNGLTIAVPRGALFDGTVDLLTELGVDRLHMALAGEERGTGALLARAGARVAG